MYKSQKLIFAIVYLIHQKGRTFVDE